MRKENKWIACILEENPNALKVLKEALGDIRELDFWLRHFYCMRCTPEVLEVVRELVGSAPQNCTPGQTR